MRGVCLTTLGPSSSGRPAGIFAVGPSWQWADWGCSVGFGASLRAPGQEGTGAERVAYSGWDSPESNDKHGNKLCFKGANVFNHES